jgi:hypothetical protein
MRHCSAFLRSILKSKAGRALKSIPTLSDYLNKTNGWIR